MKIFDNWFRKQCKKAWEAEQEPDDRSCPAPSNKLTKYKSSRDDILDNINGYTIRMMYANGGTIIQVSHFDPTSCENVSFTYIITDENEFSNEIAGILLQYKLKHG